jgi:hypothetical protein
MMGCWEENGANMLARRRGGLKPETSVRSIEEQATGIPVRLVVTVL